ncbi:DegT/DnrJ/EryC1/StrS family aminotransferase [Aestuariirhabdus haliotis]|uniref:DegT/DnrJ/EryC1/StrS family aminotransferase n=1 Tax=Aestuariirhabdus haliotis TaxID=2918751 RepID=UPI0020BF753F|nr:aminotransferase class I/II-fold pyridoxal phosphate-dependent enzyme [Aestuariirhabdus haliotis]MCL6419716.1 aminotransferase class I/II-fold pyridoxal phosphate-dependent enzyme [Aestuariirhabdus haliotis]
MNDFIKLIKPYIAFDEVSSELKDIFDSGQLTKGKHVEKLVGSLKEYTGAKHAFLTTSATTALTLCLKALGIKSGDKVAVSDFSFPATANVVEDLGATPVFVDVDKLTYNMLVKDLRKKLDSSVKAVIFVDALGNPSGLIEIKEVCQEFGIPLVEDAACGLGSSVDGAKVGAIADMTCFSFHPRKLLTTGEGGAILTNSDKYAEWLRVKLNHGASGIKGKGMNFVDFGYNYRMSEIQALLGWKQIMKLDSIVVSRNAIASEYEKLLGPLGFKRQACAEGVYHNIQSLVFTVPDDGSRDQVIDALSEQMIESTLGTYCLSATTYYKKRYGMVQSNALWLENNTITLPCYEGVVVKRVVSVIRDFSSS